MKQNLTITSKFDKAHPWQIRRQQRKAHYSLFNGIASGAYEQNIPIVFDVFLDHQ